MKNRRFLIFLLCLAQVVSARAYSPEYDENGRLSILKADLNRDGYFNMVDISLFASAWLEQDCGLSNSCEGADNFPEGGDGVIDWRDFSVSAEPYGLCTDPTNPECIHVPLTLFEPPSGSDVLFALLGGGEPMPPLGPARTKDHYGYGGPGGGEGADTYVFGFTVVEGVPRINFNFGGSFGTYGGQGAKPLLPSLPGGGGGSVHTMGRRYNALILGGGRIGGQIVVRKPPPHGVHQFLARAYRPDGMDQEEYISTLFDSCGDVFDNAENFQMAGNLVLTSEPDESGLLGSSNSLYWGYGGYAPLLPGGGGGTATFEFEPFEPLEPAGFHLGQPIVNPGGSCGSSDDHMRRLPGGGDTYTVELLPDAGAGGPEPGGHAVVQLFSGEFCVSAVDLCIPGRGPDFVWQRIYRSRLGPNTVSGKGWDFSYNIYLEPDGGNLIVHNGCGRRDPYYPEPNGIWAADGFFRELAQDDDLSFIMTFAHGGKWQFYPLDEPNKPGKISAITDRNGNTMSFGYDTLGRLATIHDALHNDENNRDITIAYNTGGFIESVTDFSGRQVKYEYYTVGEPNGSPGDLKSVTTPTVRGTPTGNDFPNGKTTTYTYTKGFADERLNHNLLTISDAKGQTYLRNIYGTNPDELSFDHVVRQIPGDPNDKIDITYLRQVPDANNNYAVTRTITNDHTGNVTELCYDNHNRLVIIRQHTGRADPNSPTSIDPNVNMPTNPLRPDDPAYFETRFQYNSEYLLTRVDYPNDNYVTNVYESDLDPNASPRSRGNLREIHRFAGSMEAVSDQNEIVHLFEYDPNFNVVTRYVDARGNETLCDYDPNGNRTRAEHLRPAESGIIRLWQYNEYGQLTAHILPDNGSGQRRRDTYAYYSNPGDPNYGYLENIVVDANNSALTATFQYDDLGNVIRIIDPRGHDTQLIVNSLNQVVRSISRLVMDDSGVRYERDTYYDENDNIVRVDVQNKDEQGELQLNTHFTTAFEYDILNYLTRTTAEVDTTKTVRTEFEYDDNHNLTLVRSGEATNSSEPNNVIRYLYDERSLVFQTIRAPGDSAQSTTQYDYDGNGNLIRVSQGTEGTPNVTTYGYDGFDRRTSIIDPMGNESTTTMDNAGNVIIDVLLDGTDMVGDTNNVRLYESNYEYDSLNRLIRSVTAHFDPNTQAPIGDGNSITQFFYNDNSQLTRVVDDNGNQRRFGYDTANRLMVVTDAKANTVTYSYDENSNIVALTEEEKSDLDEPNEIFVTTYQYDNLDRFTRVTDNNDNSTRYGYDSRGNCTRITNALNNETRYEYDGLNRLIRAVRDMDGDGANAGDANDIVTSQSWDDNSRLVTQTDDNGNTTTYEYDVVNHYVKTSFADNTETRLAHDVHHCVWQTTDAAGSVVNYTSDLLKRITTKAITPAAGVSNDTTLEHYKYDGLSRLIYAEDDDSVVTLTYDSLSNVITETLNGKTTTSVHDGLGNKLSCTYPGGRVVTCTYDELSRKKVITADGTAVSTYSYIGPGRVRRCEYGNNTKCEYTYDNIKRITSTKHSDSAGGIIDQRSYRWDNMYNKTQRKDIRTGGPQLTHDYTYDAIDRLIQTTVSNAVAVVRETDYSLDGVSNRTEVTGPPEPGSYTMDSNTPEPADYQMNQYTATPFDSRTYDKNGNLTISDKGRLEKCEVVYDYRDQVVEVNDTSTGQIHTYAYDALGRRIEKVVDSNGVPQTTHHLYNGFQVIEEQDDYGDTVATYVYGNYIDEVLNMQRGGENHYYHTDELYSVMAVTDDSASVVERYEYQEYGEPSFFDSSGGTIGGSAIGNAYLFTGRRYDPETGWYYYRSRYMDPIAGRFVVRDKIGIWGDAYNLGNGYSYAGNNPASWTDPTGNALWGNALYSNALWNNSMVLTPSRPKKCGGVAGSIYYSGKKVTWHYNHWWGFYSFWCFPADTGVWIDDQLVQISKVSAGEKIGKIDGAGAAVRLKQIEKVEEHEGTFECHDIVLETGNCITVAGSHLFMVESGQWERVENLRGGLKLKSHQGLITIRTVTKSPTSFTGKVYNLKVKDGEEYFVGKDGVIVRDW